MYFFKKIWTSKEVHTRHVAIKAGPECNCQNCEEHTIVPYGSVPGFYETSQSQCSPKAESNTLRILKGCTNLSEKSPTYTIMVFAPLFALKYVELINTSNY
jgi:hypothetical protein